MKQFQELGIIQPILKALKAAGYPEPTPIQEKAIPPLLRGVDLLGCAQTGTGKTAAFAVPILQNLYQKQQEQGRRPIRALILTPTRELAAQIDESFAEYGRFTQLKHTVIFGGVGQAKQVDALGGGVDILTATPGRLMDLIGQGYINLSRVELFVLDEADRMLDMGFLHDVERVIDLLPEKRQTMLFSATMPPEIEKLTHKILKDPEKIAVTPVASTVDSVEQQVYFVNKFNKTKLLIWLLKDQSIYSALVFTRTKHGANKLAESLRAAGETCGVIHSNKSQTARLQALADFKSGDLRVLAATDIVARGIDIAELSLVVNFDIPEAPEDYVHRIGRTGRAGLGGRAVSFCDTPEKTSLRDIEKLIGKKIDVVDDHPYPLVSLPVSEMQEKENAPASRRRESRPVRRQPRAGETSRAEGQSPRRNESSQHGGGSVKRTGGDVRHTDKPNGYANSQTKRAGNEPHHTERPDGRAGGPANRTGSKSYHTDRRTAPRRMEPEPHPGDRIITRAEREEFLSGGRSAAKPEEPARHTDEQGSRTAGKSPFRRKWFGGGKGRG